MKIELVIIAKSADALEQAFITARRDFGDEFSPYEWTMRATVEAPDDLDVHELQRQFAKMPYATVQIEGEGPLV